MMAGDLIPIIETVGNIRMQCLQSCKKVRRQPKHHTAVRLVIAVKLRTMKNARWNQTDITVLEGVNIFSYLIGKISLQKEIYLIIIVAMHGYIRCFFVFIIEDLEIRGLHFLSFVEL